MRTLSFETKRVVEYGKTMFTAENRGNICDIFEDFAEVGDFPIFYNDAECLEYSDEFSMRRCDIEYMIDCIKDDPELEGADNKILKDRLKQMNITAEEFANQLQYILDNADKDNCYVTFAW